MQGFQVQSTLPKYISFSAEIVPQTTETLIAAISELVGKGVPELTLLLSTPGGNVMNGITLYNFVRSLPIPVTTHNIGNVDSIGLMLFLAGSKRYSCRNATFMFHGVGIDLINQTLRLEEKLLRERLNGIMSDQRRIGAIIEERTKLPTAEIEGLFLEAQTKDAAFAASCGIIDEIRDAQIPAGNPVVSFVFKR